MWQKILTEFKSNDELHPLRPMRNNIFGHLVWMYLFVALICSKRSKRAVPHRDPVYYHADFALLLHPSNPEVQRK